MDDRKDDGNTTTTTTKTSKSKNLIDKLSHHRDHVNVNRDNPGRYCNINTDVTFTDGTTQETNLLYFVRHSKPFPVSKTYVVHQGNTDDLSSLSLTKSNHAVKPKHKPVNRIITKTNPFGGASIVDTTDKLAALGF